MLTLQDKQRLKELEDVVEEALSQTWGWGWYLDTVQYLLSVVKGLCEDANSMEEALKPLAHCADLATRTMVGDDAGLWTTRGGGKDFTLTIGHAREARRVLKGRK